MPIYQYQCQQCEHELEALQKMSDPKLTDCPQCGESALRKCVTAAAFRLKGTGWYETDFKNSNSSNAAKGKSVSDKAANDNAQSGKTGSDDTSKASTKTVSSTKPSIPKTS